MITVTSVAGTDSLLTFRWAQNTSNEPITGVASFNVEPEMAGKYFNKVQCFCFNEQKLEPGEQVRMPVIYYVDPEILNDPNARDVSEITLSYTFMEAADSAAGAASAPLKNK